MKTSPAATRSRTSVAFTPPTDSVKQLSGVPFSKAVNTTPGAKERFDNFDAKPRNKDKSRCKALLKFPDGTIFWSSKMAIDADGPKAGPGRRKGSELDPTLGDDGKPEGQDDTSFHFDSGKGLPSETVPYIVLPHHPIQKTKPFHPDFALGDVGIVIFGDKIAAAICGDIGPANKIGEGSIRIHEALHPPAPDPCKRRDQDGFCQRIVDASIPEDVLFFLFPSSAISGLDLKDAETRITEEAMRRYNALRATST